MSRPRAKFFAGVSDGAPLPCVQEAAVNVLFKQGAVYEHEDVDPDEGQIIQQECGTSFHIGEQTPDQARRQFAEELTGKDEHQRQQEHDRNRVPLFLLGSRGQGTRLFIHDRKNLRNKIISLYFNRKRIASRTLLKSLGKARRDRGRECLAFLQVFVYNY